MTTFDIPATDFNGNEWIKIHVRLESVLMSPHRVPQRTITRLCAELCVAMDTLGMVEYDDETYANFLAQSKRI